MADLFKEILPDINYGKKNLIRTGDMDEGEYGGKSFIINRALSMNVDTILYANEINQQYNLDPLLQYDYFINSLRKKKRWSKWAKATTSANLELVKTYYNYNSQWKTMKCQKKTLWKKYIRNVIFQNLILTSY